MSDLANGANSCLQQKHRVAKEEAGTSPLSLQLPVEFWRLTQVPEVLASPEGTSSSSTVEFYCTLCSAAQIYRMPAGVGVRGRIKLVREEGLNLVGEGEHTGPPKPAKSSHQVQGAVSADMFPFGSRFPQVRPLCETLQVHFSNLQPL